MHVEECTAQKAKRVNRGGEGRVRSLIKFFLNTPPGRGYANTYSRLLVSTPSSIMVEKKKKGKKFVLGSFICRMSVVT